MHLRGFNHALMIRWIMVFPYQCTIGFLYPWTIESLQRTTYGSMNLSCHDFIFP